MIQENSWIFPIPYQNSQDFIYLVKPFTLEENLY
jgi:hypothetical protein